MVMLLLGFTDDDMASKTTDSIDETCPICHEKEKLHALSLCNHHICYKCCTRLRFLRKEYYCPICRADCDKVRSYYLGYYKLGATASL